MGEPTKDPTGPLTSEETGNMFAINNANRTKEIVISNQNEYVLPSVDSILYVFEENPLLFVYERTACIESA